jgi:uncharacterized protein YkwD
MLGWALVALLLPHPERSEGPARAVFDDRVAGPSVASLPRDEVSAPDWDRLALEIHNETNLVRRDPVAYAAYLEELLPRFDGKLLERSSRVVLRTEEGADAVREAIDALQLRRPAQELQWSKGLAAAAGDHVEDQGPIGGLEHQGTDGSDPAQRAERRGRWLLAMAENIAYGENPARQVVIQLLVDDGVSDRGHRDNILDPQWAVEGVACGPHRDYRQICVMDYAVNYVEDGRLEGREK